jgi:hypothetical protein
VIERLSAQARSRELEQIGHEEEGLKVLQALEAEGWMKVLFPAWTSAKADEEKLKPCTIWPSSCWCRVFMPICRRRRCAC